MVKKKTSIKSRKKKLKDENTFYTHLEDLRFKILSVIIFFIIAFGVSFYYIDYVMAFLTAPLSGLGVKLNYFKPYEKFLAYIKVAFFSGLIVTIPFMLLRTAEFIYPALKKGERRIFAVTFMVLPVLFLSGAFFAYRIILPIAFSFFTQFAGTSGVNEVWGIDAYFSFITTIVFASGIIFLAPSAFLVLIKADIISAKQLAGARMYIYLGTLILSALFTPPDVVTQILLAVPLILLFEITIIIGKLLDRKGN